MSDNYLKDLFINEAKPALQRHSGGGASLDHTVTFIVDGEPYEIVSVKEGSSIDAPATVPSDSFAGWQSNGASVTFPFTPVDDMTISALIPKTHMEYSEAGTEFVKYSYYSAGTKTNTAKKINDGKAVVAGVYNENKLTIYAVSLDPKTVDCALLTGGSNLAFEYNGETHYLAWCSVHYSDTKPSTRDSYVWTNQLETFESDTVGSNIAGIGKYILDYYYGV